VSGIVVTFILLVGISDVKGVSVTSPVAAVVIVVATSALVSITLKPTLVLRAENCDCVVALSIIVAESELMIDFPSVTVIPSVPTGVEAVSWSPILFSVTAEAILVADVVDVVCLAADVIWRVVATLMASLALVIFVLSDCCVKVALASAVVFRSTFVVVVCVAISFVVMRPEMCGFVVLAPVEPEVTTIVVVAGVVVVCPVITSVVVLRAGVTGFVVAASSFVLIVVVTVGSLVVVDVVTGVADAKVVDVGFAVTPVVVN